MNRRDFLDPGNLVQAAGQLFGAADEWSAVPSQVDSDRVALLRTARRAMATTFEVLLPYGTPDAMSIAVAAFGEIDRLEQQLTVYRETSEVSRLNQLAPLVAVPVEQGLFELLTLAARISEETRGAFDISAGALIKAWGFYRGPRRVPSDTEHREALHRVGMRQVVLDPASLSVRYSIQGLEINLGSIGKGYALDRAAQVLAREWNLNCALLHGGQSSVYAMGTEPGSDHGWPVGIRHPWEAERRLAVVRLRDRALGTSAATFQHLEYNGRKLGHILDPRTGWPAEGMASASVVAPAAAVADALATAFFILGVAGARSYCESHPKIGAVLLETGAVEPVILGLRPEELLLEAVAP
jgi:thiamine biosynthesis lipoprotein